MVPGIVLRSTFIVGFPGETAQDFKELAEFIAAAKIRLAGRLLLLGRGGRGGV